MSDVTFHICCTFMLFCSVRSGPFPGKFNLVLVCFFNFYLKHYFLVKEINFSAESRLYSESFHCSNIIILIVSLAVSVANNVFSFWCCKIF